MGIHPEKLARVFRVIAKGLLGGEAPPPAGSLFQLPPPNHTLHRQIPDKTPTDNSSGLVAMLEHFADADHPKHPMHALAKELQAHDWNEPYNQLISGVGEEARPHVDNLIRGNVLEQIEDRGVIFVHVNGAPPPPSSSINLLPS